jgi:hypothetical protein
VASVLVCKVAYTKACIPKQAQSQAHLSTTISQIFTDSVDVCGDMHSWACTEASQMSIEPIHIFGDMHSGLHVGLSDGMHGAINDSMHI